MQVTLVTLHPEAPMEFRAQDCCECELGKFSNICFGEGGELQKGDLLRKLEGQQVPGRMRREVLPGARKLGS